MSAKIVVILILLMSASVSGCGKSESIADGFLEYDSTEFITENDDLSDRIPVFSVKYPLEWEYRWVADSGVIALLISSGDIQAAWSDRDYSGATFMIIPIVYSGEKLSDLFYSTLDARVVLEPAETTIINGQDMAWAEYTREEDSFIEAVIAKSNWALLIVSFFPTKKEAEFRPTIEGIINTIEIE